MNRKGSTETISGETVEMIVVALAIVAIISVAYFVYSNYSQNDIVLEGYTESLQRAIEDAEISPTDFSIYQDEDVYLIYFGENSIFQDSNVYDYQFLVLNKGKNLICFCRGETAKNAEKCNKDYCIFLKNPAILNENKQEKQKWALKYSEKSVIVKEAERYVFVKNTENAKS